MPDSSVNYINGNEHGEQKEWYNSGNLYESIIWEHGMRHGLY